MIRSRLCADCNRARRLAFALPVLFAAALLIAPHLCLQAAEAGTSKPPADPPTQVVQPPDADEGANTPAAGAEFSVNPDPSKPTLAFYLLGKTKVRLEYRDQILHLTVLSGLMRLDLAAGEELAILSTGDDIEIAGLAPAAATPEAADSASAATTATATAKQILVYLSVRPGDPIEAANHRLRLAEARPLRLRNNGGYPVTINAKGRLMRLDEGGSGIALNADGSPAVAPAARRENPRNPDNPAAGGLSPASLLKR